MHTKSILVIVIEIILLNLNESYSIKIMESNKWSFDGN